MGKKYDEHNKHEKKVMKSASYEMQSNLTWQHCKKICICEFMIELRLIDYNNAD
jgi:hypothetical protein